PAAPPVAGVPPVVPPGVVPPAPPVPAAWPPLPGPLGVLLPPELHAAIKQAKQIPVIERRAWLMRIVTVCIPRTLIRVHRNGYGQAAGAGAPSSRAPISGFGPRRRFSKSTSGVSAFTSAASMPALPAASPKSVPANVGAVVTSFVPPPPPFQMTL